MQVRAVKLERTRADQAREQPGCCSGDAGLAEPGFSRMVRACCASGRLAKRADPKNTTVS